MSADPAVNSDSFLDFGFKPRKPRTRRPEAMVVAAAKAAATRRARRTMGKKQRLKIRGVVKPPLA